jgi:hypothetical protein
MDKTSPRQDSRRPLWKRVPLAALRLLQWISLAAVLLAAALVLTPAGD